MPPLTKILIVEDEENLLKALITKFKKEKGFNVLEAQNGRKGLMMSLKNHPNLIILDILMPDMDGITMAEKLRKDCWGKTVPIIFLTNIDPNFKVLNQLINIKASYYLIKANCNLYDIVIKAKELLDETESF